MDELREWYWRNVFRNDEADLRHPVSYIRIMKSFCLFRIALLDIVRGEYYWFVQLIELQVFKLAMGIGLVVLIKKKETKT